ncbi:LysR family transcriptional regulator, partial [Salmonella enterica subsp. enterica serovar Poona]
CSTDAPDPVSLIRPLHRPPAALVDAFSKHLQTHLSRLVEPLEVILGPMTKA